MLSTLNGQNGVSVHRSVVMAIGNDKDNVNLVKHAKINIHRHQFVYCLPVQVKFWVTV